MIGFLIGCALLAIFISIGWFVIEIAFIAVIGAITLVVTAIGKVIEWMNEG